MLDIFDIYLGQNYISLFALIGLFFFLRFNVMLEKKNRTGLLCTLGLLALLFCAELLEMYEQTLPVLHFWRRVSSGFGYALRPFIILAVGFLAAEDLTNRFRVIASLPAFFNAVVSIFSIFRPLVFDFTPENGFIGNCPLRFVPHACGILYLLLFTVYAVISYYKKQTMNTMIFTIIFFGVGIALLGETFLDHFRALTAASVLSLVFFYIHLLTVNYRLDPLTGALNRKIFYLDAQDKLNEISSVIMIDLNGLKKLNDTLGHVAGDTALMTVADCCRKCMEKGFRLYRIGGDEFVILSFYVDSDRVVNCVRAIRKEVKKTDYRVAIGVAYHETGDTFDAILMRADEAMYSDKQRLKEKELSKQKQTELPAEKPDPV